MSVRCCVACVCCIGMFVVIHFAGYCAVTFLCSIVVVFFLVDIDGGLNSDIVVTHY